MLVAPLAADVSRGDATAHALRVLLARGTRRERSSARPRDAAQSFRAGSAHALLAGSRGRAGCAVLPIAVLAARALARHEASAARGGPRRALVMSAEASAFGVVDVFIVPREGGERVHRKPAGLTVRFGGAANTGLSWSDAEARLALEALERRPAHLTVLAAAFEQFAALRRYLRLRSGPRATVVDLRLRRRSGGDGLRVQRDRAGA